jgi:EAL domain-containing protein (putative c-di-GMP-specific phosphodiesterase class I)
VELVECPPDYLKLDMSLIRAIHKAAPTRQRLVATLVQVSNDSGIAILAEGIELAAEADYCRDLGVKLAQGYHFGRPAAASDWAGAANAT